MKQYFLLEDGDIILDGDKAFLAHPIYSWCPVDKIWHNRIYRWSQTEPIRREITTPYIGRCTCYPVPKSLCLSRQLYVDDNCPQHGIGASANKSYWEKKLNKVENELLDDYTDKQD